MLPTLRLLANVKPARYLEAGYKTGLTGLFTHPSPRMTLMYLYSSTLEKLKTLPDSSLYRQSAESLTKHRMALVEGMVPPGYAEWKTKADKLLADHPDEFLATSGRVDGSAMRKVTIGSHTFVLGKQHQPQDIRTEEWDGEQDEGPELEGSRTAEERKDQALLAEREPLNDVATVDWVPEPSLTADQIAELETKIGAGLIEEVIQVAEGEMKLVDIMAKAEVWKDLEEKPTEGQWKYFERQTA